MDPLAPAASIDWPAILIRITIWLAVAGYLGRVACDLSTVLSAERDSAVKLHRWRWSRRIWIAALFCYLAHVVAAFHFVDGWSHTAASHRTAIETEAVTGWAWGGGLWVSYAFTTLWLFDAIAWWHCGLAWPYRHRGYFWTLHALFAFIVINATLVF